jgi:hypothetical protein
MAVSSADFGSITLLQRLGKKHRHLLTDWAAGNRLPMYGCRHGLPNAADPPVIFSPKRGDLSNGANMPHQIIHITLAFAFVSVWALVGQIVIRSNDN